MKTSHHSSCKLAVFAAAVACTGLSACDTGLDAEPEASVDAEENIGAARQALGVQDKCPEGTGYDLQYGNGKLLFCSQRSIFETNSNVKRAIVVIRGSGWISSVGGYEDYFTKTLTEASAAGVDLDEVDVIAPRLLMQSSCVDDPNDGASTATKCMIGEQVYETSCNTDADCRPAGYYRWGGTYTGGAQDATGNGVSVYDAMDLLLWWIAWTRPNLETIVVAGQSQGAQLVSRYAISSHLSFGGSPQIRYWSANAGSYAWLDDQRPNALEQAACGPGYDDWPWGLDGLYQYHADHGVDAADMISNAVHREIYWTAGSEDTAYDQNTHCANSQGDHRLARWAAYRENVHDRCVDLNLPHCESLRDEQFLEIPGAGHGMIDSWEHPIGHRILFGSVHPSCSEAAVDHEVFDGGGLNMVGCAGTVSFADRGSLCAPGYAPCGASQWHDFRDGGTPHYNYWTDTPLRYGGSAGSCWVDESSGFSCPGSTPMRVCTAGGADPLGNACNWSQCSYDGGSDYFGGCVGNTTAGTLCCPAPQ